MNVPAVVVTLVVTIAASAPVDAQTLDFNPSVIPPIGEPSGTLLQPERHALVAVAAAAPKALFEYRVGPTAISTQGATIAGLGAGLTWRGIDGHTLSLDTSYMTINTPSSHLDRYEAVAKFLLINHGFRDGAGNLVPGAGVRVTTNGEYWDIPSARKRIGTSVSLSFTPVKTQEVGAKAHPLKVIGGIGWARSRVPSAGHASDVVAKVGFQYTRGPVVIGSDYRFKNDVDGVGQWGVSATHVFGQYKESQLIGRVGRGGTVVVSYTVVFQ